MKKLIFVSCILCILSINCFSQQALKLDTLAYKYFTNRQIDTMSMNFIKVQNYIIRYSWAIYHQWDKNHDTIVQFNRDTVNILPYLSQRNNDSPYYIYGAYPGLVIVLDSKSTVKSRICRIYSEK